MNKYKSWQEIAKGYLRFDHLDSYPGLHPSEIEDCFNNQYPYVLIIDKKTKIVYSCPFEADGILDLMESV